MKGRGFYRKPTSTGERRFLDLHRVLGPAFGDWSAPCEKAADRTRSSRWRAGTRRNRRRGGCGVDLNRAAWRAQKREGKS